MISTDETTKDLIATNSTNQATSKNVSSASLLSVNTADLNAMSGLKSNEAEFPLNSSTSSKLSPMMANEAGNSSLSIKSDDLNSTKNDTTSGSNDTNLNISFERQANNNPLNEKVTTLATSIYTELEKIVKLHGRDTVKDLMPIVVNVLEALDTAYHEKEELIVENELQKDDNEKLLNQYEREKQARKDTELRLFQSEDSFAEQKKEFEEKIKSLESIVRMIDLKSKNTSDHVLRLEEKESELKREYNKLHERYTDLFKTHCDYMERTKIVFGSDGRMDNTNLSKLKNSRNSTGGNNNNNNNNNQVNNNVNNSNNENLKSLFDLLKSNSTHISKSDLINALKYSTRAEINNAISSFTSNDQNIQSETAAQNVNNDSSNTSLTSLISNNNNNNGQQQHSQMQAQLNSSSETIANYESKNVKNEKSSFDLGDNSNEANVINLQSSDNFDEHIGNNVEFDDSTSDNQSIQKQGNELEAEYEGDDEVLAKNDLSLFNELSRDNYDIAELDDGADLTVKRSLFGMTREVANLIRENSELLQTKHALNVLKDDLIVRLDQFSNEMVILREEIESLQTVKACLQLRITELEEEAKKAREENERMVQKQEQDDEVIPMSQRKRFTRAEMARVLMERNQYKERLMDLQEAVRWTEMMRASKIEPSSSNKDASFDGVNQQQQMASGDSPQQEHKKKTTLWKFFSDLFGTSQSSQSSMPSSNVIYNAGPTGTQSLPNNQSRSAALTTSPKKKVLQANDLDYNKDLLLLKDETRMQAYGWSLPSKKAENNKGGKNLAFSVPVPVYCRPLFENDNNLKLSSSSIVNYTFDRNLLKDCGELIEASPYNHFKSTNGTLEETYKSSCIWICNLNDNDTHISILDSNKPSDLISQFTLKAIKVYCIQSISGVSKDPTFNPNFDLSNLKDPPSVAAKSTSPSANKFFETQKQKILLKEINLNKDFENITYLELKAEEKENEFVDLKDMLGEDNTSIKDKQNRVLSTAYPTMWMGSQEGFLLIHSSISNVSKTLEKIKLNDAVLCIIQSQERVIVGLADGSLSLFSRNNKGIWDIRNYIIVNFDKPHHSIRSISNVYDNIWSGCRNKIFVFDPIEIKILASIEVHPRKENQVRHIVWWNDGVWVSLRLDSTLRLYNAKTYQHLQYLDIEPFITRMLGTSNLGLSLIRISSLLIGCKRLWIGTGNGVILSIPFSDVNESNIINNNLSLKPGSVVRINPTPDQTAQPDMIPYCNLVDAQFSFHGHRDSIKFFLNVPSEILRKISTSKSSSSPPLSTSSMDDAVKAKARQDSYEKVETLLILSGGHGYIDFRIGDTHLSSKKEAAGGKTSVEVVKNSSADAAAIEYKGSGSGSVQLDKIDRSHLIVWQMNNYNN